MPRLASEVVEEFMKKDGTKPQPPTSLEKAKRRYHLRRLLGKKWFFPVVYVTTACLIFSVLFVSRFLDFDSGTTSSSMGSPSTHRSQGIAPTVAPPVPPSMETRGVSSKGSRRGAQQDTSISAITRSEAMGWPVPLKSGAVRTMGFYQGGSSKGGGEGASLIHYENVFFPHSGIDFARPDGHTFDVLATAAGRVTRVEEDAVVGKQVEVTHPDGRKSIYQSLADIVVQKGQSVQRGQVLARAGNNRLEGGSGVHLHLETLDAQGRVVNPENQLRSDVVN
ncbi:M23 family metallopeptidase [Pasteuria penetrans]|uniref:M23 family metallopeptidase n=1 Tax=Pasteuria penetrans TaxID=86005 RepID=UPI000F95A52A|nr:M23 family metallopeptidase [Pasteuria penetrans]